MFEEETDVRRSVELDDLKSFQEREIDSANFKTPRKRNITMISDEALDNQPYKKQCPFGNNSFKGISADETITTLVELLMGFDIGLDKIFRIVKSLKEKFNISYDENLTNCEQLAGKIRILEWIIGGKTDEAKVSFTAPTIWDDIHYLSEKLESIETGCGSVIPSELESHINLKGERLVKKLSILHNRVSRLELSSGYISGNSFLLISLQFSKIW